MCVTVPKVRVLMALQPLAITRDSPKSDTYQLEGGGGRMRQLCQRVLCVHALRACSVCMCCVHAWSGAMACLEPLPRLCDVPCGNQPQLCFTQPASSGFTSHLLQLLPAMQAPAGCKGKHPPLQSTPAYQGHQRRPAAHWQPILSACRACAKACQALPGCWKSHHRMRVRSSLLHSSCNLQCKLAAF